MGAEDQAEQACSTVKEAAHGSFRFRPKNTPAFFQKTPGDFPYFGDWRCPRIFHGHGNRQQCAKINVRSHAGFGKKMIMGMAKRMHSKWMRAQAALAAKNLNWKI